MKKKDLIKVTLKAYNKAIKTIKDKRLNFQRSLRYLEKNHLDYGVCKFITESQGLEIVPIWVYKYGRTDSFGEDTSCSFWGKVPQRSCNRKEIMISLSLRKDILSGELKESK